MENSTISNNKDKIKPFYAIKIFEKGKELDPEGKKTIHLSLGEPSVSLPKKLLDKAGKQLFKKKIGYTESIGLLELRKEIVKHYLIRYDIEINLDQVAITSGASASILLSLMSLFKNGDTVAVVSPGYPCYVNILKSLNLKVFIIQTKMEEGFNIDLTQIINLPSKVKGIIIASPSNPTGATIDHLLLNEINNVCLKRNITLISDEIYQGITYKNNHKEESLLSFNSNGIVINSFSKYFLMTGWRLGWIVSSSNHIKEISKIAMNVYLSPSSISQYTALETFKYYNYFDDVVKDYYLRRNYLKNKLNEIGLNRFFIPNGAFYFYIDISKYTNNSYRFCEQMVKDINVTCAPGIDFDDKRGKNYVRFSYSCEKIELEESLKLIKKWL